MKLSSQDSKRTPGANTIHYTFFSKEYNDPYENNVGIANYDFGTMAIVFDVQFQKEREK